MLHSLTNKTQNLSGLRPQRFISHSHSSDVGCLMSDTSPGEWSLSFCLPFQKHLDIITCQVLWPSGILWPQILTSLRIFFNFVNKSLSSINTSCYSAIALYYLWLLLLSEFIAIISQQPFWHSQPAICHSSPWWKAVGRTWAVTQHPKLWMMQSSWRASEIVIKRERETERGERTNEGDLAPCQNSGSQSLRNDRETVTAEPGTKHLRDWLPPEQPSFTINNQRRYATKVCFLQSQKQLRFLNPDLVFTVQHHACPMTHN